jgi:hypothetical protein
MAGKKLPRYGWSHSKNEDGCVIWSYGEPYPYVIGPLGPLGWWAVMGEPDDDDLDNDTIDELFVTLEDAQHYVEEEYRRHCPAYRTN